MITNNYALLKSEKTKQIMQVISEDLSAEYQGLHRLLSSLHQDQWQIETGFKQWSIYDHCCHLCISDEMALLATGSRVEFEAEMARRRKVREQKQQFTPDWKNELIPLYGNYSAPQLIARWSEIRQQLLNRLKALAPKHRLPWHGPDMSAKSFATARLMETWAHGQSIYDSLNIIRKNSHRLKHICQLGYRTFGWSFSIHNLPIPDSTVSLNLSSPDGEHWHWGKTQNLETISGSAEDFCLVVTQCRNFEDTNLSIRGNFAQQWMEHAQCFAGGPAENPKRGERRRTKPLDQDKQ